MSKIAENCDQNIDHSPTIANFRAVIYNTSVVKICNAPSSLVRFENVFFLLCKTL
jgi:hypothetical protein